MKVKVIITLAVLLSSLFFLSQCTTNKKQVNTEYDLKITLRWVKAYNQETKEKVALGLKWVLSYLGAMLPSDTVDQTIAWTDDNDIELDLAEAGFTLSAQNAWNKILQDYRLTKEYQLLGSLDIGRFVMMSFNSSDNYYAITGVEKNFDDFKQKYRFESQNQKQFLPGQSSVTNGLRNVFFSTATELNDIAHIAEEGHGEYLEEFEAIEFEVFDFMTNGQPRFAVYDLEGKLKIGGDKSLSFAGKPAKCMWCHESTVQLPFRLMNDYPNSPELYSNFKTLVDNQNGIVSKYYKDLSTEIDTFRFDKSSHYFAELLYITYQHPTKKRAINELKMIGGSIQKGRQLQVSDSVHHEFRYLKNLVSRKELDHLLPYQSFINIDARETELN